MIPVIINAILVGITVWIASQLWHINGIGLVFACMVIYVCVRVAFGLVILALNMITGRERNAITWV
jgi:hypothetical protein